ncbi:FRG domain-containing protein [Mesorhizobium neociceri]|uniref:FRG domain-containing protein n=1 Tax=Mesorhizobium neociceri TaxID=1307853 RepID=A0A838B3M1_9HYPH|nr:FRG domain-containing protein [Mesorhizobium neociceri]MBA1140459.1 FRG domain-containing protein [Mesorhizobium neociceri]
MREISPKLTPELQAHCNGLSVDKAPAFQVTTFRRLVEQVAKLAYINHDDLLFFRGQDTDYLNRSGGTTLYPGIYRGDSIPERELRHRFDMLEQGCRLLVEKWQVAKIDGYSDIRRKKYIQWSILQHYEVAETPLIDLTHSLRVACSFAQLKKSTDVAYVYVLGLPHVTNRISVNSEHDLVNVRLLSICPPAALRPHFQEGYLAGTTDVTTDFDSKTELDFRNRLVAKFSIPSSSQFWGSGFNIIPATALFPRGDKILELCNEVKSALKDELQPGDIGSFIGVWAELEDFLLTTGRRLTERNISVREAIARMLERELITPEFANELQALRMFRNNLVHQPTKVRSLSVGAWLDRVRDALKQITAGPSQTSPR